MIREKTIFRNILFGAALLVAGASAMALSSCAEKEMSAEPVVDGSEVEICFTPSLGNGTATKGADVQPLGDSELFLTTIVSDNTSNPFADVMSRATSVTGFDPNGTDGTTYASFGVYSYLHDGSWGSDTSATPYINGVEVVSLGNGTWSFEESVFWPAWDTNMTFFGYAPFSVVVGGGETDVTTPYIDFTDPAVTSTGLELDNQYDLLVAKTADVTKSASSVSMKFAHALTAVRFVCGEIDMVGTITKIGLSNVKYSGVYDMSAESWTLTNDAYNYEITTSVAVSGIDASGEYTDKGSEILAGASTLMMLPQQLSGTVLTVEFTAEDGTTVTSFTMELSTVWSAGTEVTYSISLADNRIDIIPYLTDENFKAYCIENYSSDGEHVWYPDETEGVTEMDFVNSTSQYTNITDFTGIYWFENLQSFTSKTAVTLDVSQNLELSYIFLGGTSSGDHGALIDTLDLSCNTKLDSIVMTSFEYCTNLEKIALPSSCTAIGPDAFMGCAKLETVTGWESLTKIGFAAFYECTNLKSATLAEGLESIGWWAFYRCTNLAMDVVFPHTLKSIGDQAFYQAGVTSFAADDEIEQHVVSGELELGTGVFEGCTSLTSAVFPDGWTTIRESWFSGCTSLTSITLPSSVTTIEKQAFANTGLSTIELPTGLTTLGYGAFQNCTSLTEITIPSGVTLIDGYTFSNCGALTYIDLPAITSVGNYAFYNCYQLATMILRATNVPEVGGPRALDFDFSHTFNHATHTLYVPASSVADYVAAWGVEGTDTNAKGKFANILTIENDLATTEP